MSLRLEIRGVKEVRAKLGKLRVDLDDWEALWERLSAVMVEVETIQFETEGAEFGPRWDPLAPSTIKDKIRYGFPLDPLIRTDALFESLTDPLQAMDVSQGRSTIGTFTANQMTWGTDVTEPDEGKGTSPDREYAHYHQGVDPVTGELTSYGGRPPERQVIPWDEGTGLPITVQQKFTEAEDDWVEEMLRESGLD